MHHRVSELEIFAKLMMPLFFNHKCTPMNSNKHNLREFTVVMLVQLNARNRFHTFLISTINLHSFGYRVILFDVRLIGPIQIFSISIIIHTAVFNDT
jgi:hypothetical protein